MNKSSGFNVREDPDAKNVDNRRYQDKTPVKKGSVPALHIIRIEI